MLRRKEGHVPRAGAREIASVCREEEDGNDHEGRVHMKVHIRTLTALLVVLAVLGLTGGDATFAQPKPGNVFLEFTNEGKFVALRVGTEKLNPTKGYKDPLRIEKFYAVGVAFSKAEPKSPAWCSVWVGAELFMWQC
jgi:hypothetical protein